MSRKAQRKARHERMEAAVRGLNVMVGHRVPFRSTHTVQAEGQWHTQQLEGVQRTFYTVQEGLVTTLLWEAATEQWFAVPDDYITINKKRLHPHRRNKSSSMDEPLAVERLHSHGEMATLTKEGPVGLLEYRLGMEAQRRQMNNHFTWTQWAKQSSLASLSSTVTGRISSSGSSQVQQAARPLSVIVDEYFDKYLKDIPTKHRPEPKPWQPNRGFRADGTLKRGRR